MTRVAARRRHAAASAFALLAVCTAARAEPFESGKLRLDWQAPPGCPSGSELVSRIEALLGAPVADALEVPLAARGRVRATGPQHFELALETFQHDQRFTRHMSAPSCAELGDATALVLALAIDPALGGHLGESASPPPDGTSAGAEAPAATPPAAPAPPSAAPPAHPANPEPAPEPPGSPELGGLVSAALLFDLGSVATYAFGATLGLGGRLGAFELAVDGNWLPPRRSFAERDPEKGGDLALIAVAARPCFAPRAARLEPGLCGAFELGDISGEGFGTASRNTRHALWIAAGAHLFGRYELARGVRLSARLGLLRTLQGIEFTLENVGLVYSVPPWIGRANLGVEMHFD